MSGVSVTRRGLERILKASLVGKSQLAFDVLVLDFAEEGLVVRQSNRSSTMALVLSAEPRYFESYEAIGRIAVTPKSLLEALRDYFKDEPVVRLEVGDGYLRVVGEGGTVYREPLVEAEDEAQLIDASRIGYSEWAPYIASTTVAHHYEVDPTFLKSVKKKWERVTFRAGGKTLHAIVRGGVSELVKPLQSVKRCCDGQDEIEVDVSAADLAAAGSTIEGQTALVFTVQEGEPGPVTLAWRMEGYMEAFIIAPLA